MADQSLTKLVNERSILTLLRVGGPLTRAEIARRLSLTPATITRLVADMMERNLLMEVGSPQGAVRELGRPGVGITINPTGAYFLGAEIGVGIVRLSLIDLAARVVRSEEVRVSRHLSPEGAVKLVVGHLKNLDREPPLHGRICAAGVTVPGLVTLDGFVVNLPILGWANVNLLALLAGATSVPFTVENNANAAAFGALYAQPSLPSTCTLFLKLGTGCGGAAIVNGRLLRGAQGTGLEAGHIRLTEQGALCSCGQTGCLESWVNLAALARLARGNADLSDAEFTDLPAQVAAEAERGEPRAVAALQSLSHHLGLGLVSLINLFNPTTILLGGVMRPVMERVLPDLRAAVTARIIPGTRAPEILLSTLGEQECAVGAACIAHHKAFDLSNVEIGMPPLREAALG